MDERLKGLRLLLTTDAVGGVWTYSLDLARELSHAGVEIVLAVVGPAPSEEARAAARAIPGLGLVDTGLPLDWTAETPEQILDAGTRLSELAHEQRCSLVQLHTAALAAARSFEMPVISVHHSCIATWWRAVKGEDVDMPEDFRWRAALVARGLAASSEVVAPSTAHAHAVAETYALPAPPLVIRNGRRQVAASEAESEDTMPPFVLSSGRLWDEGKNFAALSRAAALIHVPVVAAGATAAPGGPEGRLPYLHQTGRLTEDDMRQWLARAAAFASTALYEPFGLGVLEAAQAGCPLVLSDIASFRELWAGAALFVPPRDEQAIAQALAQVLADEALRQRLSRRARHRAQHYTAETMAKEMMRLYVTRLALHRTRARSAA